MESSRNAWPNLKHDLTLRKTEGRLVDKLSILQQGENKKRSYSGQDCLQEELRKIDKTLSKVRARETT